MEARNAFCQSPVLLRRRVGVSVDTALTRTSCSLRNWSVGKSSHWGKICSGIASCSEQATEYVTVVDARCTMHDMSVLPPSRHLGYTTVVAYTPTHNSIGQIRINVLILN